MLQYLNCLLQNFKMKRIAMINKGKHSLQYKRGNLFHIILSLSCQEYYQEKHQLNIYDN